MKRTLGILTGVCFLATVCSLPVAYFTGNPTLLITFGTTFYHFAMRLLVGWVFDRRMGNRAEYTKRWYQPRSWEPRLYETLRVKNWKDKLPSYDPTLFSPKVHTWDEIAQAMCQAELVHEACAVLSFLPLFAAVRFGAFPVFFLTSLCGAALDLIFVVMQRYNRPRVVRIAQKRR